jgi:hypothetical protein
MTRSEATKMVDYKKGPIGATAICPVCRKFHVALRRGYTWGDVAKAKAEVASHILAAHEVRQ